MALGILRGCQRQLLNPWVPDRQSEGKRKSSYLQNRCDQKWLQPGRDNIEQRWRAQAPRANSLPASGGEGTWAFALLRLSAARKDLARSRRRPELRKPGGSCFAEPDCKKTLLLRVYFLGHSARRPFKHLVAPRTGTPDASPGCHAREPPFGEAPQPVPVHSHP